MTGVPEVVLALEAGLRYAALALVVNPAAGLSAEPITMDQIGVALEAGRADVLRILDALVAEAGGVNTM